MNFIDLFCGCGGFTLGMERAGFQCLAAIDFNADAVATLKTNLPHIKHVLHQDLTAFPPEKLLELIETTSVDVIVGGPPCQGFSTARQVDGANHGERLKDDPRRHLYRELLKYVEFFKPKIFVMENVLGIKSAAGGEYFMRVQSEARALGYRVHGQVEDAWELGVPQKRRRQLIIGTRADIPGYFRPSLQPAPRALPRPLLGEAIGDLPFLRAGGGNDEAAYDLRQLVKLILEGEEKVQHYLFSVLEIDRSKKLLNHVARPHSERDLRDFSRLKEGESSAAAMRNGVEFEFPYDRSCFKDRYTRQSRFAPCSTIVAHLSKDGLMFIHPTQKRSLTPREAARVQSFPDWFKFPNSRTHSFRMIGNAVPPLVAEAVGLAVVVFLEKENHPQEESQAIVPRTSEEALAWLIPLIETDKRSLRFLDDDVLLRAWKSILFLYFWLHPDGAPEKGIVSHDAQNHHYLSESVDRRLLCPYYKTSGWPLALVPIAEEARRRFNNGIYEEDELYCSAAQIAGIQFLNAYSQKHSHFSGALLQASAIEPGAIYAS